MSEVASEAAGNDAAFRPPGWRYGKQRSESEKRILLGHRNWTPGLQESRHVPFSPCPRKRETKATYFSRTPTAFFRGKYKSIYPRPEATLQLLYKQPQSLQHQMRQCAWQLEITLRDPCHHDPMKTTSALVDDWLVQSKTKQLSVFL